MTAEGVSRIYKIGVYSAESVLTTYIEPNAGPKSKHRFRDTFVIQTFFSLEIKKSFFDVATSILLCTPTNLYSKSPSEQ